MKKANSKLSGTVRTAIAVAAFAMVGAGLPVYAHAEETPSVALVEEIAEESEVVDDSPAAENYRHEYDQGTEDAATSILLMNQVGGQEGAQNAANQIVNTYGDDAVNGMISYLDDTKRDIMNGTYSSNDYSYEDIELVERMLMQAQVNNRNNSNNTPSTTAPETTAPETTPKNDEQEPETTPKNDEQEPETTPKNDEQEPETAPKNDEQKPETAPKNDEQKPETAPKNDEQKPETAPKNDEQKPETTPKNDDKQPKNDDKQPQKEDQPAKSEDDGLTFKDILDGVNSVCETVGNVTDTYNKIKDTFFGDGEEAVKDVVKDIIGSVSPKDVADLAKGLTDIESQVTGSSDPKAKELLDMIKTIKGELNLTTSDNKKPSSGNEVTTPDNTSDNKPGTGDKDKTENKPESEIKNDTKTFRNEYDEEAENIINAVLSNGKYSEEVLNNYIKNVRETLGEEVLNGIYKYITHCQMDVEAGYDNSGRSFEDLEYVRTALLKAGMTDDSSETMGKDDKNDNQETEEAKKAREEEEAKKAKEAEDKKNTEEAKKTLESKGFEYRGNNSYMYWGDEDTRTVWIEDGKTEFKESINKKFYSEADARKWAKEHNLSNANINPCREVKKHTVPVYAGFGIFKFQVGTRTVTDVDRTVYYLIGDRMVTAEEA